MKLKMNLDEVEDEVKMKLKMKLKFKLKLKMKLNEVEVDDKVEEADDQLLTKLDQTKLLSQPSQAQAKPS